MRLKTEPWGIPQDEGDMKEEDVVVLKNIAVCNIRTSIMW